MNKGPKKKRRSLDTAGKTPVYITALTPDSNYVNIPVTQQGYNPNDPFDAEWIAKDELRRQIAFEQGATPNDVDDWYPYSYLKYRANNVTPMQFMNDFSNRIQYAGRAETRAAAKRAAQAIREADRYRNR